MGVQMSVEKDQGTGALVARGRVNTATASILEEALAGAGEQVTLDLSGVDYLSSAGLRVILAAHKRALRAGGGVRIEGCVPEVLEVFQITGLVDLLEVS